jgi:hypothetical protein
MLLLERKAAQVAKVTVPFNEELYDFGPGREQASLIE